MQYGIDGNKNNKKIITQFPEFWKQSLFAS